MAVSEEAINHSLFPTEFNTMGVLFLEPKLSESKYIKLTFPRIQLAERGKKDTKGYEYEFSAWNLRLMAVRPLTFQPLPFRP
jgi:hypothetical protein